MSEQTPKAADLTAIPVKLPDSVTGEIKDLLASLKENYSLRSTVQEVFWWLTGTFLTHKVIQDEFVAWLKKDDLPDYGAERMNLFRIPKKLDLDLRIYLGKLGYDIGRRLTIRQAYLFVTTRFVENNQMKEDFRLYVARKTRAQTETGSAKV